MPKYLSVCYGIVKEGSGYYTIQALNTVRVPGGAPGCNAIVMSFGTVLFFDKYLCYIIYWGAPLVLCRMRERGCFSGQKKPLRERKLTLQKSMLHPL